MSSPAGLPASSQERSGARNGGPLLNSFNFYAFHCQPAARGAREREGESGVHFFLHFLIIEGAAKAARRPFPFEI